MADIFGPDATAIKEKMRQSKSQHITFEEHTEEDNKLEYSEERTKGRPGEADRPTIRHTYYCANENIQHWLARIHILRPWGRLPNRDDATGGHAASDPLGQPKN